MYRRRKKKFIEKLNWILEKKAWRTTLIWEENIVVFNTDRARRYSEDLSQSTSCNVIYLMYVAIWSRHSI